MAFVEKVVKVLFSCSRTWPCIERVVKKRARLLATKKSPQCDLLLSGNTPKRKKKEKRESRRRPRLTERSSSSSTLLLLARLKLLLVHEGNVIGLLSKFNLVEIKLQRFSSPAESWAPSPRGSRAGTLDWGVFLGKDLKAKIHASLNRHPGHQEITAAPHACT